MQIETKTLKGFLKNTKKIWASKTLMPITNHVLIDSDGETATCTVTDMDILAIEKMPVFDGHETAVCLPAETLLGIINANGENMLDIEELEKRWLSIKTSNGNNNVVGADIDDFPEFSRNLGDLSGSLSVKNLKKISQGISKVSKPLKNEMREHLKNVRFELDKEACCLEKKFMIQSIMPDSSGLLKFFPEIFDVNFHHENFLIGKTAIEKISGLLGQETEIMLYENYIVLDGKTIIPKSQDWEFPKISEDFFGENFLPIEVDRKILKQKLTAAIKICNKEYKNLRLNIDGNCLKLIVANPDVGESMASIDIINENFLKIDFYVNAFHFSKLLDLCNSETITLKFENNECPVVLEDSWNKFFLLGMNP